MNAWTLDRDVPLLRAPSFLEAAACRAVRLAMDRGGADPAEIVADTIRRRDAVRRTRSVEVDPATLALVEQRFEAARPQIAAAVGRPVGQREGAGFLRYEPGGFYRPHRDRGEVPGWPPAARRALALVLFLNDGSSPVDAGGFQGGELCLYPASAPPAVITPSAGLLVVFPADLLHEVRAVRAGVRDSVVDWCYDPDR